jgi:hypothetical protein
MRLTGSLDHEEYIQKKGELLQKRAQLKQELKKFSDDAYSPLEPAREFVQRLNQAIKLVRDKDPVRNLDFLTNVGSNLTLTSRQIGVTLKNPWNEAAELNRKIASGQIGTAKNVLYPILLSLLPAARSVRTVGSVWNTPPAIRSRAAEGTRTRSPA